MKTRCLAAVVGRARHLADLVGRARYLLLDFDGPVCDVFASHPASAVADGLKRCLADGLRRCLDGQDVRLPERLRRGSDSLDILRYTATLGRAELTLVVDDALRAAELIAVRGGAPTPHVADVIGAAVGSGRRVGIVSNNSAQAIHEYLRAQGLAAHVYPVIGRPRAEPALMKPDPTPVYLALRAGRCRPAECLLIGDSVSDIEAARAANVGVIGYANKPGKDLRLAGADAVITSMSELLAPLAGDGTRAWSKDKGAVPLMDSISPGHGHGW